MGAEQAPKRGRPTEFDEATASEICRRIAEGESLRSICTDEDMPARSTVFLWLRFSKTFSDHYARAREDQAESLADEVMDTALNKELDPSDRRVRVDALKWLAGKRKPKVYGDRVQTELTGRDGGPVELKIDKATVDSMDADELDALERALVRLQQGAGVRPPSAEAEESRG